MPQRLKQLELQDNRANQNTGLEEVQDYSRKWLFFSEEITELKIQIETGFETEQDLKKSLQQLEGI